ncbi:hypothetical protein INT47_007564, partial [Mucor saturninus]
KSSFQHDDAEDLDSQLKNLGLCTKNIAGDGNCLFRSLSDQFYGQDGNHKAIRHQVCQFLRDNKEEYQFFVEDDQSFEHHVDCMSRNATYGGNMELAAFAKMQQVNIKVYQPGLIYIIHGKEEEEDDTQVLHIAFPMVTLFYILSLTPYETFQIKVAEDNPQEEIELTSQEKIVSNACPDTNLQTIRQFLKKHKGIPDDAINAIYESQLEEAVETHDEALDEVHLTPAGDAPLTLKEGVALSLKEDAPLISAEDAPKSSTKDALLPPTKDAPLPPTEDAPLLPITDEKNVPPPPTDDQTQAAAVNEKEISEKDDMHPPQPSDTDGTTHDPQEDLNMHEQDLLDQFPNIPPETIQTVWRKHGNSMDAITELQGIVLSKPKKQKTLSSRERKELAKKKRKEEAMLKKRAKAQRQQGYKEQDRPDSANDDITKIIKTMKEIDI